jgi:hypothetical protein
MKNQVIEVLDREHWKKVLEYWKSKGIDTSRMLGISTKKGGYLCRYYGVIDGCFDCYSERQAAENGAEIIELPEENSFPRVMLVSDDGDAWYKRVVFMQKCDRFLAWNNAETIENAEWTYRVASWRYAKEIEPKQRTITLSDLNSKIEDIKKLFGIDNEDVIIKLD